MLIRAGYSISYECPVPTPMMLMLSVHPERLRDLRTPQHIEMHPGGVAYEYRDGFGNICSRTTAGPGVVTFSADFTIRDSGQPDPYVPDAIQHPVEDLPESTLQFLLGSRYCETDRLGDVAWSLFGGIEPGWGRVQAIVDYCHQRIEFGYPHARATRTAFEAHEERRGVCRDFAHLAVALCRCMNIPARYCTGYLGDIRIAPIDATMDFSAWFDVYLGGRWYTFDARHNTRRIGRILMARGRDATDVALSTAFGTATLVDFQVHAEEVD